MSEPVRICINKNLGFGTKMENPDLMLKFLRKVFRMMLNGYSFKESFYTTANKMLTPAYIPLAYKIIIESLKDSGKLDLIARDLRHYVENHALAYAIAALILSINKGIFQTSNDFLSSLGIKRKIDEFFASLKIKTSKLKGLEALSFKYSLPLWLVARLVRLLGIQEAIHLMRSLGTRISWLRVNTLKLSVEHAIRRLEAMGLTIEEDKNFPEVLKIVEGNISKLATSYLVQRGYIFFQDKASVAAVYALKPMPGDVILDACAAPGMKTTLMAQLMENKGLIVAVDISWRRLKTLFKMVNIAGAEIVKILHADSRKLPIHTSFDKILIDAPCSSSGAIAADPSLRLRLNDIKTIEHFSKLQLDIISTLLPKGSEIVYSVCSLLPEEGEAIIDFLHSQVRILSLNIPGDSGYPGYKCSGKVKRLFPHKHQTLGFFISKVTLGT